MVGWVDNLGLVLPEEQVRVKFYEAAVHVYEPVHLHNACLSLHTCALGDILSMAVFFSIYADVHNSEWLIVLLLR